MKRKTLFGNLQIKQYSLSSRGYILISVALYLSVIIIFIFSLIESRKDIDYQFQMDTLRRTQVIRSFLNRPLEQLTALRSFFSVSDEVTSEEFEIFIENWMDSNTFDIIGWFPHGGEEDEPVLSIPPLAPGEMLSRIQRDALYRARGSGTAILTEPFILYQSKDVNSDSIVIMMPVYSSFVREDSGIFRGTLFLQFSIDSVVGRIFKDSPALGLSFRITSGFGAMKRCLYYFIDDNSGDFYSRYLFYPRMRLESSSSFPFVNQTWTIDIEGTQRYYRTYGSLVPWIILLGGLIFSSFISYYLYQRARQKQEFMRKIDELDRFFILTKELLCITNKEGFFIRVNPEWEKILGFTDNDLHSMKVFDLVHPDDLDVSIRVMESIFLGEMATNIGNRLRCKNGEYRCMEWRAIAENDLIYAAARDVTDRSLWEKKLVESLHEKDILLKEIHHRVKNNLQIITSMLNLEMMKTEDDDIRSLLLKNQYRITTIAMVHEILYNSENMTAIHFAGHVEDLLSLYTETRQGKAIDYCLEIDDILLPLDIALPCGLIVNEIITNSIQHALDECENPRISIHFSQNGDSGRYHLIVSDNGPGYVGSLDPEASSGLGLKLIAALTEQIGGCLETTGCDGAVYRISFPLDR